METKPKQGVTIFLIASTFLLSLALVVCGIYSLYISIGFKFLQSSVGGINTNSLYTFPNSTFGTGNGRMFGLIIISIVMLGLGIGMAIIFFKQMPLYKQIKFIAKMPNVKYKHYSKQAKKSVIVYSVIAYIICILFSIFAIVVAFNSGISSNYLWVVIIAFSIVLALSIASMVLMFVKIGQLAKIRKTLKTKEELEEYKTEEQYNEEIQKEETSKDIEHDKQQENADGVLTKVIKLQPENNVEQTNSSVEEITKKEIPINQRLFTDGIFELGDQLQKLREIHISGLISGEEYTQIRQKWINAVLNEPLFGKKTKTKKVTKTTEPKQSAIITKDF